MNYSVLMAVYRKEDPDYLRIAMNSMWNQTIPPNDFVLVCDGPLTEGLDHVISQMESNHMELQVIRLENNSGLGQALNKGLKYCKNEYIARMDSDDISKPDRCERQLQCFLNDPELKICSGTVAEFTESIEHIIGKRELPTSNDKIIEFSKKRNPFNHPSVMFKKSAVINAGGYDETYHLFEDYYLWIRMLMKGNRGENIQGVILFMRTPENLYMRRGGKAYAKEMISFHKWMKDIGWSSKKDYYCGAIPHYLICILPNSFRKTIYKVLHH